MWKIDDSLFDNYKKRTKKTKGGRKNFVLSVLCEAEHKGMESSVWQHSRSYFEVFVILRNHIVHDGLEFTKELADKLCRPIQCISEFPGHTTEQKLKRLGPVGNELIQIPSAFVFKLFDLLEELATCLIVPVDSEVPDLDLSFKSWLEKRKLQKPDITLPDQAE